MGNVIIACVYAGNEALQELIAADIVAAGVDKTRLVRNVISELAILLDADNVAGILIDRFAYQTHQSFRLAGSLQAYNQFDHNNHSPCKLCLDFRKPETGTVVGFP